MATCPRCKGPLTDGHRCPMRYSFAPLEIVASALVGALACWILLFAFDPHGQLSDDALTILIGAVAGVAINRLVRS